MSTRTILSSIAKRPTVLVMLVFTGAVVSVLFSGCIFAAVHTARFIERKVNPPQPALHGSALFFEGSVKVTLLLRSTERRRRPGAALSEDGPDDPPKEQAREGGTKARMTLLAIVTNTGTATVEISVLSIDSVLGNVVSTPKDAALAGGQRIVLEPLRSARDSNLDALTVSVSLKRGDTVEKQEVALAPFPKKNAGESE